MRYPRQNFLVHVPLSNPKPLAPCQRSWPSSWLTLMRLTTSRSLGIVPFLPLSRANGKPILIVFVHQIQHHREETGKIQIGSILRRDMITYQVITLLAFSAPNGRPPHSIIAFCSMNGTSQVLYHVQCCAQMLASTRFFLRASEAIPSSLNQSISDRCSQGTLRCS